MAENKMTAPAAAAAELKNKTQYPTQAELEAALKGANADIKRAMYGNGAEDSDSDGDGFVAWPVPNQPTSSMMEPVIISDDSVMDSAAKLAKYLNLDAVPKVRTAKSFDKLGEVVRYCVVTIKDNNHLRDWYDLDHDLVHIIWGPTGSHLAYKFYPTKHEMAFGKKPVDEEDQKH